MIGARWPFTGPVLYFTDLNSLTVGCIPYLTEDQIVFFNI